MQVNRPTVDEIIEQAFRVSVEELKKVIVSKGIDCTQYRRAYNRALKFQNALLAKQNLPAIPNRLQITISEPEAKAMIEQIKCSYSTIVKRRKLSNEKELKQMDSLNAAFFLIRNHLKEHKTQYQNIKNETNITWNHSKSNH